MSIKTEAVCTFDGCDRAVNARGLCPGHYAQVRSGRDLAPLKPQARKLGACMFDGCGRSAIARNLCNTHWHQWRNGTPLREIREMGHVECSMKSCSRSYRKNGWCALHAARALRGWDMTTDTPPVKEVRLCEFEDCDRPHLTRGLCNTHNQQRLRGVELMPIRSGGRRWRGV